MSHSMQNNGRSNFFVIGTYVAIYGLLFFSTLITSIIEVIIGYYLVISRTTASSSFLFINWKNWLFLDGWCGFLCLFMMFVCKLLGEFCEKKTVYEHIMPLLSILSLKTLSVIIGAFQFYNLLNQNNAIGVYVSYIYKLSLVLGGFNLGLALITIVIYIKVLNYAHGNRSSILVIPAE